MTQQIRDKLIYEGETYDINQEILERYFRAFPEKKPEVKGILTSLWRGYVATFEIQEKQLFVKKFEMLAPPDLHFEERELDFLGMPGNKFSWYSGLIRIDDYKGIWNREEADATFEYLEIYKGDLLRKRVMNYDELQAFKEKQYAYFKTTLFYEQAKAAIRKSNPNVREERIEEIIRQGLLNWYTRELFDNEKAHSS